MSIRGVVQRTSAADLFFWSVIVVFMVMIVRIWWIPAILPGMDYPQFLVFVRVLQDYADPSSPFHGTYAVGHWYMPTSLPLHVVSWLSYLCGHSVERAGRILLTCQNIGLVAATLYLLKLLGRPRWAVSFILPLVHSGWTVVAGFIAYASSLPIVVLSWALTVRWLLRRDARSGIALGVCLSVLEMWHGMGFLQAGLGFGVIWLLWRAPSWRWRLTSVLPTVPSLLQCTLWMRSTFAEKAKHVPWWPPKPWVAADKLVESAWAKVPHAEYLLMAFGAIVVGGLVLSERNVGASGPAKRMWRVRNPFIVLSLVYASAFFLLPIRAGGVDALSTRFMYTGLVAFTFAWNLPRTTLARIVSVGSMLIFASWCLADITQRFESFAEDTRGASELIDRIGLHETLYSSLDGEGASKEFAGVGNKPMREIEQFATIRHGGLPNSSFAGYGYNYISYVDNRNPMPGLAGSPHWSPQMTKFDWVLARGGQLAGDNRFLLVENRYGWDLYGVCGSAKFPTCP